MVYSARLVIVFLFVTSFFTISAQTVEDDFEGNGTITTWFGDNCGLKLNLSNPLQQGINTSQNVLEYHDTGGQYANVRFDVGSNYDLSENHTFSLKIYVPSNGLTGSQPNQISLKLQDGNLSQPWVTQSEIIKPIQLDQWQTVSFDFENDDYINLDSRSLPPIQRTDFNRVVLQVNGENNNDHVLAYLDDILYDGTIEVTEGGGGGTDPVFDSLVWSDEFNGSGAIDTEKWFHQTKLPNGNSWYNNEIQHYTNREENTYEANGVLNLVARKETFTDQGVTMQYTSARLNSKFAFTYGKVEIRAKLPFGVGTWPALWMLGKNITEVGAYWYNQGFGTTPWPNCGEIDIMEHWGDNQNFVQSATHTPSSFGNTVNKGGQVIPTVSNDFHVYTLYWSENKLVFSVDDLVHFTYNPSTKNANTWPFDDEQYLLFNVAILPNISANFTQSAMEVDYVRVYQENTGAEENDDEDDDDDEGEGGDEEVVTSLDEPDNQQLNFYPNPANDELTIELGHTPTTSVKVDIYRFDGVNMRSNIITVSNNEMTINNLRSLTPGFYLLHYQLEGEFYTLKFVKE